MVLNFSDKCKICVFIMNSTFSVIVLDKPGLTASRGKQQGEGSQIFQADNSNKLNLWKEEHKHYLFLFLVITPIKSCTSVMQWHAFQCSEILACCLLGNIVLRDLSSRPNLKTLVPLLCRLYDTAQAFVMEIFLWWKFFLFSGNLLDKWECFWNKYKNPCLSFLNVE